jgi:hypothetical protein
MIAKYLWVLGSTLIAVLGITHLYYTFFTNAFSSRNERMIEAMKFSSPILSQKITMWKAWVGFNGSHSSGAIFIGISNLYLVLRYFRIVQTDHFFFVFNILTVGFYVWLAEKYWLNIPLLGLSIALGCFIISYGLILLNN